MNAYRIDETALVTLDSLLVGQTDAITAVKARLVAPKLEAFTSVLVLSGPPGCGKSLLARTLPSALKLLDVHRLVISGKNAMDREDVAAFKARTKEFLFTSMNANLQSKSGRVIVVDDLSSMDPSGSEWLLEYLTNSDGIEAKGVHVRKLMLIVVVKPDSFEVKSNSFLATFLKKNQSDNIFLSPPLKEHLPAVVGKLFTADNNVSEDNQQKIAAQIKDDFNEAAGYATAVKKARELIAALPNTNAIESKVSEPKRKRKRAGEHLAAMERYTKRTNNEAERLASWQLKRSIPKGEKGKLAVAELEKELNESKEEILLKRPFQRGHSNCERIKYVLLRTVSIRKVIEKYDIHRDVVRDLFFVTHNQFLKKKKDNQANLFLTKPFDEAWLTATSKTTATNDNKPAN